MARLHIDMYIHDMLQHSALLRSVASDMLVTGMNFKVFSKLAGCSKSMVFFCVLHSYLDQKNKVISQR